MLAGACAAQTKLNIRTQTQSADMSAIGPTKPFQTGSALPSSCTSGQAYFLTNATPGSNLYGCTATGVWTQIAGGGGGGTSGVRTAAGSTDTLQTGDNGKNVVYTGTGQVAVSLPQAGNSSMNSTWKVFLFNGSSGNVTVTPAVSTIDGASSILLPPLQGLSLWSDGTNYYSSGTLLQPGAGVQIINRQLSADTAVVLSVSDFQAGTPVDCFSSGGNPTAYTCSTSSTFPGYVNGMRLYWQPDAACTGAPTLSVNGLAAVQIRKAGGGSLDSGDCGTPYKNITLAYNSVLAGGPYWEVLDGSSGGSGGTVLLPPTLVQTNQSNAYTAGTQDFSGAQHVLPMPTGLKGSMSSNCSVGEQYFATDATAGQNVYSCTAMNTWTQNAGSSGGGTVTTGGSYLPFGFNATTPPATGWTGLNMTGSTFTTSGLGGALNLLSKSFTQSGGSLAAQYLPMGSSTTLNAVISASQVVTGPTGFCSVGVLNTSTSAAFMISSIFSSTTNVIEEESWANGLAGLNLFQGNQGAGNSSLAFFRLQLTGSALLLSYSPNGLVYTQLASRTLGGYGVASSYNQWVFAAGGPSSNPVSCTLLSWSAQ